MMAGFGVSRMQLMMILLLGSLLGLMLCCMRGFQEAASTTVESRKEREEVVNTIVEVPTLPPAVNSIVESSSSPTAAIITADVKNLHVVNHSIRILKLRIVKGGSSLQWKGLESDADANCITPPPFRPPHSTQCTMHEEDAIVSCLKLRRKNNATTCRSVTCPDSAPYVNGKAAGKKIHGPICQARSGRDELGEVHPMCKPNQCMNIFFDDENVSNKKAAVGGGGGVDLKEGDVYVSSIDVNEAENSRGGALWYSGIKNHLSFIGKTTTMTDTVDDEFYVYRFV
jgi:hypothetical protein